MESSKLLVTLLLSLPLSTDAFLGAKHFNGDDKRGERHAYFVRNPVKRLNSSILVSEPMACFFRCISYQECYSVNFAAVSHDGRHMCELLNAEKFQNSSSFLHLVRREWPSGQSAGLWVGRPGFKSWMGHYVVALSKSLHSPCFVFSDKTLSRRSRLLQGLG